MEYCNGYFLYGATVVHYKSKTYSKNTVRPWRVDTKGCARKIMSKDIQKSSGTEGEDSSWSKLISSLMSMKKYTPRVLKRELVLILR